MKKTLALTFSLLLLAAAGHAGSPVWKISGHGTHIYLGGTLHVLAESDYPLPQVFDTAFKKSRILVFETDLDATRSPEFGQKMMEKMLYSEGIGLKDKIRPQTLSALNRFAGERGIAAADLDRCRPGLIMVFLTMAEMERMGMTGIGVDAHYFQKGKKKGMPMDFLESPMDQIRFLAGIGQGNEDEMISYIIKDIDSLPGLVDTMKTAWRQGDLSTLYRKTLAPLKNDFPDLYQSLMTDRNLNWLPAIEKMLATPEVEFILVGTAHLAGDHGLIRMLEAKGYRAGNL